MCAGCPGAGVNEEGLRIFYDVSQNVHRLPLAFERSPHILPISRLVCMESMRRFSGTQCCRLQGIISSQQHIVSYATLGRHKVKVVGNAMNGYVLVSFCIGLCRVICQCVAPGSRDWPKLLRSTTPVARSPGPIPFEAVDARQTVPLAHIALFVSPADLPDIKELFGGELCPGDLSF